MNQEQFEIRQHDLAAIIEEHGELLSVTQNTIEHVVKAQIHQVNGAPEWVREYRKRDETSWFVARVSGTAFPDGIDDDATALDALGTHFTVQDFKPIGRPYEGKFVGYVLAMSNDTRLGGL